MTNTTKPEFEAITPAALETITGGLDRTGTDQILTSKDRTNCGFHADLNQKNAAVAW